MSSLLDRFNDVSSAISSGEFDTVGSNSTTFNYGTGSGDLTSPFPALPAITSTFAPSATSPGNVVASSGGTTTGGATTGAGTIAINGTASAPSNAQAGVASSGAASTLKDYFLRAVIIILGFVFVAVGLNMFRPGTIPNPVRAVKP